METTIINSCRNLSRERVEREVAKLAKSPVGIMVSPLATGTGSWTKIEDYFLT
jgi:hypothetical protein